MRACPRSRFEDKDGIVGPEGFALMLSGVPEYPEVVTWRKEYAAESDRLAEEAAKKIRGRGKRRWGRWTLNPRYYTLDTRSWRPAIDDCPARDTGIYDIDLSTCRTKHSRKVWIEHMSEKNWVGEKGLADLRQAFDELVADGTIVSNGSNASNANSLKSAIS